jgi:hypothetical protein
MARVTHVKKAQQRYETVIVRDDEGNPKKTPVMRKDGSQKMTRAKSSRPARPVFMTVTVQDKSKPKPLLTCDHCRKPIEIGTPYKHITPKSGPYGGRQRNRHEGCPTWQVWDYSNSLSAQLARISHDFWEAVDSAESPDDVTEALNDASSSVEEIAEQKQEGADNIESGFGHATSASEELAEMADQLKDWAGEIEQADVPEMPACEECTDGEIDCDDCEGTGEVTDDFDETKKQECETCSGNGTVECENCDGSGEDIEEFREEVRNSLTIVDESPV